jgi:hypothetical protein
VLRHYTNADSALRNYDPSQLPAELRAQYRGDAASIARIAQNMDGRVKQGIILTPQEQAQLIAFLKSLTDPSARDLSSHVPASVPSGLPIR